MPTPINYLENPFEVKASLQSTLISKGSELEQAVRDYLITALSESPVDMLVKTMECLYTVRQNLSEDWLQILGQSAYLVGQFNFHGKGERAFKVVTLAAGNTLEGDVPEALWNLPENVELPEVPEVSEGE